MKKSSLLGAVCACMFTIMSMSANAALVGRLETFIGSGVFQAYYDDQLNITWTTNANINGTATWGAQVEWADTLTIDGVSGWRLASMDINDDGIIVDCSSDTQAACIDNEYGHLFHYGAGTILGSGITAASQGPFIDIAVASYWSSTEYAPSPSNAWFTVFSSGFQGPGGKVNNLNYAWAVHAGDVGAVPIPAAVWLFGSGLIGLISVAKRKKT